MDTDNEKQNSTKTTLDELKNLALKLDSEIAQRLYKAGLERFNVFDVLNISRQELCHNDFLAFLLDPQRNDNINEQFLRRLMLSEEIVNELNFADILYGNFDNISVNREYSTNDGRIDILIEFELDKAKKQKYLVAIENKTDSTEHDDQLARYKNFLSQGRYRDYKPILLYLTIDKGNPKCDGWIAIDYKTVCNALEQVNTNQTDKLVTMLINDYKEILKREFIMETDELKQLARKIYAENKTVLDFIYKSLPDWSEIAAPIVHTFLKEKGFKLQSEKQKVNIMFHIDGIADRYWFQINLRDLSLYFMDSERNYRMVSKVKWLAHSKATSITKAEKYSELAISNPKELKRDFKAMLEQAFDQDKIVAQCVADIADYEKKIVKNYI